MEPEAKLDLLKKAADARGLLYNGSFCNAEEGLSLHSMHLNGYSHMFNPIDKNSDAFKLMFDLDIHVDFDLGTNEMNFSWFDGEQTRHFSLYVGAMSKCKTARLGITIAASMMNKEEI